MTKTLLFLEDDKSRTGMLLASAKGAGFEVFEAFITVAAMQAAIEERMQHGAWPQDLIVSVDSDLRGESRREGADFAIKLRAEHADAKIAVHSDQRLIVEELTKPQEPDGKAIADYNLSAPGTRLADLRKIVAEL